MSHFARLEQSGIGRHRPWLDQLRKAGHGAVRGGGFPDDKDEEWRFTNVAPIARTPFGLAEHLEAPVAVRGGAAVFVRQQAAVELVFVNGHFSAKLSSSAKLPRGVKVSSLRDAIEAGSAGRSRSTWASCADIEDNPFVALNTGFVRDGAFVHIGRERRAKQPIHLLFVSVPTDNRRCRTRACWWWPRTTSRRRSSRATSARGRGDLLHQRRDGDRRGRRTPKIDHSKLQQESAEAYHVATMQVADWRGGGLSSRTRPTIGAKLTRNDLNVSLAGEGADATLNGLVLIGGEQHCDNHTLLDHAEPQLPEPRAVQARAGRQGARRVQGQDPRPARMRRRPTRSRRASRCCSATTRR